MMNVRARIVALAVVGLASAAGMVTVLGGFSQRAEGVVAPGLDAHFPSYPGTQFYPMGDSLSLEGVPVQMGYFTASGSPTEIAHFYADFWSKEGLNTTVSTSEDRAEVGAYDEVAQAIRSVSVVRQGNHAVTIASIMPLQGNPVVVADEVPTPDGAMLVRRARSAELGRVGQSLSYLLSGSLAQAEKTVTASLAQAGWVVARTLPQPKLDGASVRLTKGPDSALVTLVTEAETQTVGVQIHVVGAEVSAP
jgi:hypothetical protein